MKSAATIPFGGTTAAVAGLLLAMLVAGAVFAGWAAARADRELRADQVERERLVSQAISLDKGRSPSATQVHLESPEYWRLKGMNVNARARRWEVAHAAITPLLFTFTLMGIVVVSRRVRSMPSQWRHAETAITFAVGLTLTLAAAWVAGTNESRRQREAFSQLAHSQAARVVDIFHSLGGTELEALGRFLEGNQEITRAGFDQFVGFLSRNPSVQAWEWIPAVPSQERPRFEQDARQSGLPEYGIWQKDESGERTPAAGHGTSYPVRFVAPLNGNERALGYDLGSEPARRLALEQAELTGFVTATEPITLVQETSSQKGVLVYRPVFTREPAKRLRGFALAVLRLGTLLETATGSKGSSDSAVMNLFHLREGQRDQRVASTQKPIDRGIQPTPLSVACPIFAFGQTFALIASSSPAFERLYPARAGWTTALAGLAITAALALAIGIIANGRRELEGLVAQRTEALRANEQLLSATLRSIGDGVIACDAAGNVVSLNSAAESLTGWSAQEARGRRIGEIFRIVDAQTRQEVEIPVRPALRGDRAIGLANGTALIARDGTERQIADSCAPIHNAAGGILGAVLVFRDVTEEHRQREQLRESEARLRTFTDAAFDGIAITEQGVLVDANLRLAQLLGYEVPEMLGRPVVDFIAPEDRALVRHNQAAGLERPYENRMVRKDRSIIIVETQARQCIYAGRPMRLTAVHDITERRKARQDLARSEAELAAIYDSSPLMMCLVDSRRQVERMNRAMTEFALTKGPNQSGQGPGDILHCVNSLDDRRGCGAGKLCQSCPLRLAMLKTFETGQPCRQVESQMFLTHGDLRREFQVSASTSLVRLGETSRVLLCLEDITQRKRLEAQFLQAQKMDAIGQLAGGVAHDFNNFLAAIMMQLGLLGQGPTADLETRETLKELEVAAKRAAGLTRQLLMFSRRSVLEKKALDVNEVVENLLKMLQRLIGEHIELRFEGAQELPLVEADAGMVEQVLMNLTVNARDAMPNGGQITISTTQREAADETDGRSPGARRAGFVCLSVVDTGCGMDEATLKRMFEPFFTTKEVGKGTGLGLATVHGIVAQHKGRVEVESQVDKGSTFRVFLPALDRPQEGPAGKETSTANPLQVFRGDETILLVEDEPAVRRNAARLLRLFGYGVIAASNGREAMIQWEKERERIALLLTDMVMPEGLSGLDLALRFQTDKPELQVIISSGYSAEMTAADRPSQPGITHLPKPFEAATLGKAIRSCLDDRKAATT